MNQRTEVAVFGGGCFWCTEAVFERLKGVISVAPGYAGGTTPNPTYAQVCTGRTGHAEVAEVKYDPAQIAYSDLLTVFFYTSEDQKRQAETFIEQLDNSDPRGWRIVTEVSPLDKFYEAEDYHHEYYRNNFAAPYCQFVIEPKLEKLHTKFKALLRASAAIE